MESQGILLLYERHIHGCCHEIQIDEYLSDKMDMENNDRFYELPGEPNSVKFTFAQYSFETEQVDLSGEMTFIEYDTASKKILHTFLCREASIRAEDNKLNPNLIIYLYSARDTISEEIKMFHWVRQSDK